MENVKLRSNYAILSGGGIFGLNESSVYITNTSASHNKAANGTESNLALSQKDPKLTLTLTQRQILRLKHIQLKLS